MPTPQKGVLYLADKGPDGLPTFDGLMELFRKLTGREPTPEEIVAAKQAYQRIPRPTDGRA
jgi:hypothetical protein